MDILIEEFEGSLWAAALEKGRLEGLEVDPAYEEVRWGAVYWAKVKSIDAALDAAYLDLDGDNIGLLYNKDLRKKDKKGKIVKGGKDAIGKTLKSGDMVAVQAKTAYLQKEDGDNGDIENKNPVMSMDITLPGRHLIYCPLMQENRLSMRIRDPKMRKQLKTMLQEIEDTEGLILRASAANTQTDVLRRESKILREVWDQIQKYLKGKDPGLILAGPDAIQRTLSDQAGTHIGRIEVVTMDHYNEAEEWCTVFAPDLVTKIEPVEMENATEDLALFHYRDILGQIEELFQSYALLPGGGNIIIQQMSALTAVDVNRGGDKRSNLAINTEAARELARHIRLRNLGGIIVVDLLRLQNKKDEEKLTKALEDAFSKDPCTVQIHGYTKLGLLEITRKRRTPSLRERFEGFFEFL